MTTDQPLPCPSCSNASGLVYHDDARCGPAPLAPPPDWLPAYQPQKNGVADERHACPWCFVVFRGDHDCRFKPARALAMKGETR